MPINSNLIYHNSLTKIMRRVRETPGRTENFFRCLNCSKLHQFKICLHSKEKSANRNCKFFRNLEMAWLLCTECSYKTPKQYNLTRHMEKHTKTQKKKEKKREREKDWPGGDWPDWRENDSRRGDWRLETDEICKKRTHGSIAGRKEKCNGG